MALAGAASQGHNTGLYIKFSTLPQSQSPFQFSRGFCHKSDLPSGISFACRPLYLQMLSNQIKRKLSSLWKYARQHTSFGIHGTKGESRSTRDGRRLKSAEKGPISYRALFSQILDPGKVKSGLHLAICPVCYFAGSRKSYQGLEQQRGFVIV